MNNFINSIALITTSLELSDNLEDLDVLFIIFTIDTEILYKYENDIM